MNPDDYHIYALAENTLTVQMQPVISKEQIQFLHRLRSQILARKIPAIHQVLVSFHELSVFYDSTALSFESVRELIQETMCSFDQKKDENRISEKQYTIPVCYDEKMAWDIDRLESHTGLPFPEIVRRHSAAVYTFYMMGFLPGFLYLGGLDDRLSCSRLKEPRTKIEKGSVGIAGQQTGIYSMESPGGWNIIGRTPLNLFDFQKTVENTDQEHLIQPLEKIKFEPIFLTEYKKLQGMTFEEYQQIPTKG